MTTIFQNKNRFGLMTNGVVDEQQFTNCNQLPTTTPTAVTAPRTSSTPPAGNALENVEVVKSQPEIDIVISNVVVSFSLGCHLNLRQIALNATNVEFRRESGQVKMKLRKPRVTASLWSSGKISCTGATSSEEAIRGARRIARIIQKLGFNVKLRKLRIVNVLASTKMPFEIKIHAFSQHYREAEYEPELHPGVTFKIKNPKATLKIFSTGSITVTAPSVPNVDLAIKHIYPLVFDFRKELANGEDALCRPRFHQDNNKLKRKRLNSDSCSSNDEEDKEVESIMSR